MDSRKNDEIAGWGVDGPPYRRPGVPRELKPKVRGGAHWKEPERQPPPDVPVLKRKELEELTSAFSTANPPKGLSGLLRTHAYAIPEHLVRHTLLLLVADRVDVLESRLLGAPGKLAEKVLGRMGGGGLLGMLNK
jgi:hypothetical protein